MSYIVKTKMTSRNKLVVMASYGRDEQVPYRRPPVWLGGPTASDLGIISGADGSCRKWSVYFSTDLENFTVAPDEEQHVYFQLESAEIRFASLGESLSLVRHPEEFQEEHDKMDTMPDGKQYYVLFDGEGSDVVMNTWDGTGRLCWKSKHRLRILEDVKTGDTYSVWYQFPCTNCIGWNPNNHHLTPVSTYAGLMDHVLHAIKCYKLKDYYHAFDREKE